MCKINVVLNRVMLGNRELGWEVWNGKEIEEYTSKQLESIIKAGKDKVCGLKLGGDGELEMDYEGFYTTNLMEHRHIGNYKAMNAESHINMNYVCVGSAENNGKKVYNCISNKFEQAEFSEEDIKSYIRLGVLGGGAKLDGDKVVVASLELPKKEETKAQEKPEVKSEEKPEVKPEVKTEQSKNQSVPETPDKSDKADGEKKPEKATKAETSKKPEKKVQPAGNNKATAKK